MELMPEFWAFMMARLFRVHNPRFSEALWRVYTKSAELKWQLALCAERAQTPQDTIARVKHLGDMLSPAQLIYAAEKLAQGKIRTRENIAFQEAVLGLMDQAGKWRW